MLLFGRNRPPGDSERILNFDDFNPGLVGRSTVGDVGRIDFRSPGGGDFVCGGDIGRTVGVESVLSVGAGPDLIDERIVYRPASLRDARGRCR